jgi:hypothetical protein
MFAVWPPRPLLTPYSALYKSEVLTTLLQDLRGVLNEEYGKLIDDTLQQFEDDTPPSTPSLPTRSTDKQWRSSSADVYGDGQAPDDANSENTNEDPDYFDEDLLQDEGPSETGYLGRNSQFRWIRTLQRKLEQSEGSFSHRPHGSSGDGEEAITMRAGALRHPPQQSSSSRPLKDYYFYLDKDHIDNDKSVDPDIVPSAETAHRLFKLYQDAVDTPFRILDDQFGNQLRTYYQLVQSGGAPNVCPKWKAIMNLVFAIGARFSQLIGTDWQADDCDHSVYMSRAVHYLELEKTITHICAPDKSLIQASVSLRTLQYCSNFKLGNWIVLLLLLDHRSR